MTDEEQKERKRVSDAQYYRNNAEKVKAQRRDRYWANPEKARASTLEYQAKHKASTIARATAWNKANREKRRLIKARNMRTRKKRDLGFRLEQALRKHLWRVLKRGSKSARTIELLGCDVLWLVAWLETHFLPDMTWENWGVLWHVDHIRPCAAFDLEDPAQQKLCFHWTNLQPLYAWENMQKQDSLDWQR